MRMSQLLNEVRNFELDEGFSPKEIKMAIGIASDPRYAKGNMTGAVTAIERMKKGLSKHPQVAAVLKRQNENLDEAKFQINYSKGGKLFSKTINAKDEDDAESKAIKQFKIEDDDIRSVVKEAVSPAQQAAIAISKKERGEKPKDEKDEGNAFGAALEKARKNGDKTFVVSGKTYNVEDYNVEEQIDEVKLSPPMIAKIKKTFEPLRGKKIGPTVQDKLMKTMDKIDSDKGTLIDLYKAGIPFVSQLAVARLISKHNMKADQINKFREEVELDEKKDPNEKMEIPVPYGLTKDEKIKLNYSKFRVMQYSEPNSRGIQVPFYIGTRKNIQKMFLDVMTKARAKQMTKYDGLFEEVELDEGKMKQFHMMMDDGKSAEEIAKALKLDLKTVKSLMKESLDTIVQKQVLYHKTFSDAMQHAYDYAKKKLGITVDPKEIDNKVATGPKKPSVGKTNIYRLKGKGGNLQIQVYNKGGRMPFELNMYKEENEMTKSLKDTIVEMWSEAVSPAQQAAIAISKKEKEEKDEGNAFGAALKAARDNGDDTFMVSGKKYKVEDYKDTKEKKLDPVGKEDGDIDNDGDKDATDKYLAKRRKAISKAIKKDKKESFERYYETKQGSLRDAVLQMWGEVNEKVEYVEYKFKNEKEAKAAKSYFDGIQLMSFNVNDDNVGGGELMVDAGSKDMTKYHKEVMKKFKPKVMKTEKNNLTKEKKDGIKNKMTDTGKEVTPVELSPKMPKVKESKNKV